MLKNFSPTNESHLRSALRNSTAAVLLLLAFAVTASAYTLVFRNGRRMEIPSEFTLTRTTLTYEVSPGFSKTIQLILIDVAATERANNEAPGSFFKHPEESPVATQPSSQTSRTLTNRDLAAVRQRRIESEQAYERRRKELGLPTVGETRSRQEAEGAALRAEFREESVAKAREETHWRERARELRTEIAMTDNQINYLRGRLNEVNESCILYGLTIARGLETGDGSVSQTMTLTMTPIRDTGRRGPFTVWDILMVIRMDRSMIRKTLTREQHLRTNWTT